MHSLGLSADLLEKFSGVSSQKYTPPELLETPQKLKLYMFNKTKYSSLVFFLHWKEREGQNNMNEIECNIIFGFKQVTMSK